MRRSPARPAFHLDQGQRVARWFPSAQASLGFTEGEALGRPCYELFQCRNGEGQGLACGACPPFIAALEGRPGQRQLLLRRKDGYWAPFLLSWAPLPSQPMVVVLLQALAWPDLPALETVTGAVARSSNLDQTLDIILDRTLALTRVEAAEVFLAEGAGGDMVMADYRGLFPGAFAQITRFRMGEGFPGLVAATGSPLGTSALGTDSRYLRSQVKGKGFQFYLCLPLLAEAGVVGCLNVASRSLPKDEPALFQRLWPLAHIASAAVQLSRLRSLDLVAPWEPPGAVGASTSLEPLLRHILQAMMMVEGAEGGVVSLWEPKLHELRPRVALGPFQERICSIRPCPALERGQAVVFSQEQSDAPPCRGGVKGLAQVTCLPLLRGQDRVGLISLGSGRRSFPPTRHLALFSAMAARAAQVIGQAQGYPQGAEEAPAPVINRLLEKAPGPFPADLPHPPGGRGASLKNGVFQRPFMTPPLSRPKGYASSQKPTLDFRCFGGFQVVREGSLLPLSAFGRRQAVTVLKILLTRRGRPVSQDYLMECLWPNAHPEAGRNRLHVVIHDLRRCLEAPSTGSGQAPSTGSGQAPSTGSGQAPSTGSGQAPEDGSPPAYILREGGSYRFNAAAPYRLDVDEFSEAIKLGQRLEARGERFKALQAYLEASQLYGGDYLEDEPYSDWCSVEREVLRETYISLLKAIAGLCRESGDMEGCIRHYRQALAVDEVREEVHRELMRSLWQAGRRDEAVNQYLACRQVLAQELGVNPLPETEELYRAILNTRYS